MANRENNTSMEQKKKTESINKCSPSTKLIRELEPEYGPKNQYTKTGLKNLGNTCYFNAIIQCMVHMQPIVQTYSKSTRELLAAEETPPTLVDELTFLTSTLRSGDYRSLSKNLQGTNGRDQQNIQRKQTTRCT